MANIFSIEGSSQESRSFSHEKFKKLSKVKEEKDETMQYTKNIVSGKSEVNFKKGYQLLSVKNEISPENQPNILNNHNINEEESIGIYIYLYDNMDILAKMINAVDKELEHSVLIAVFDGNSIIREKQSQSFTKKTGFINKLLTNRHTLKKKNDIYFTKDFVFQTKDTNNLNSENTLKEIHQYQRIYKSKLLHNICIPTKTFKNVTKNQSEGFNTFVSSKYYCINKDTNWMTINKIYNVGDEISKEIQQGNIMILSYQGPTIIETYEKEDNTYINVFETEIVVYENQKENTDYNNENKYIEFEDMDDLSNSISFCSKKTST